MIATSWLFGQVDSVPPLWWVSAALVPTLVMTRAKYIPCTICRIFSYKIAALMMYVPVGHSCFGRCKAIAGCKAHAPRTTNSSIVRLLRAAWREILTGATQGQINVFHVCTYSYTAHCGVISLVLSGRGGCRSLSLSTTAVSLDYIYLLSLLSRFWRFATDLSLSDGVSIKIP